MNSTENDAQLIADFMRLQENDGVWTLEVAIVEWAGPHTPELRWVQVKQFPRAPTDIQLATAQQRLLTNSRYFRVCSLCNERNNVGHMHNRKICQGCAERKLGVVH